jgi:hypothetical protein
VYRATSRAPSRRRLSAGHRHEVSRCREWQRRAKQILESAKMPVKWAFLWCANLICQRHRHLLTPSRRRVRRAHEGLGRAHSPLKKKLSKSRRKRDADSRAARNRSNRRKRFAKISPRFHSIRLPERVSTQFDPTLRPPPARLSTRIQPLRMRNEWPLHPGSRPGTAMTSGD